MNVLSDIGSLASNKKPKAKGGGGEGREGDCEFVGARESFWLRN